jgi:hypothetical protein
MPYIYDSKHVSVHEEKYLTIGSLVSYGSVADTERSIGIIVGVETYNFGIGNCTFLVYSAGQIIKTEFVLLIN